jgi:hypothetical protein
MRNAQCAMSHPRVDAARHAHGVVWQSRGRVAQKKEVRHPAGPRDANQFGPGASFNASKFRK